MKIINCLPRDFLGIFRHLAPVAYGMLSQVLGLVAYLYCIHFLVAKTSSNFLAHYFIVNSIAIFVAQIATAGIDGKLYYNSMIGSIGRQRFQTNGFVYLPIAILFSLIFIFFSHYIFPFALPLQALMFLLTTILFQPLLANLLAFNLAEKKFNLSNFIVVAPWGFRALFLLCLSYSGLSDQFDSRPDSIYIVFSLSTVLSLSISLLYGFGLRQCVPPDTKSFLCFFTSVNYSVSRINLVYLLANISSLIPYSIAPYILFKVTADTVSVSVLGTFLSLLSVFVTSVGIYNTRLALPHLFRIAKARQLQRAPMHIISYSIPICLIYTFFFALAFWPFRSIVLNFLGPTGDLIFNLYWYLVLLVFLSIFSVPAHSLLSGGKFLLPWASVKFFSCAIALIALFTLVPSMGLLGCLLALVLFGILQALGCLQIFNCC